MDLLASDRASFERGSPTEMRGSEFRLLRGLVHQHTGIWLQDGKRAMLSARLAKPVRRLGVASYRAYYGLLCGSAEDSQDFIEFINAVTTNKTSFFREAHHFRYLRQMILPEIEAAAAQGGRKQVRVWSAACSTGEEVYSIAITLLETISDPAWWLEVVGSDIDTRVLATARDAIYPVECLGGMEQALIHRYFLAGKGSRAGQVRLKPELTKIVELQRLNLMDERWDLAGSFDVIFFRNALIYFQQDVQDLFLRKMARMLRPGGYLFLGSSEQIPWLHEIFEPLNHTMYRLR
jgi:chemotaxis protein methyltransferase CheR